MDNSIKILLAGDFCSRPSTAYISVSDELRSLINSCDLGVVNFEVPLKPDGELPKLCYEPFYQNDDAPDFLRDLGFNLFSMANNHMFDCGVRGFQKTKAALGNAAFGSGTYDEAYRVKTVDVKGVKIGFMALSYAAYYGVFDDVASQDGLGCAYINDLRVNHNIVEAKKEVDYLFILPHDGIEYIDVPLPEIMARYRDFIDYGADAVVGSHPHCPQGWEEYKGKPIFYSLGNFFFNSKDSSKYGCSRPHWYEGLCVVMELLGKTVTYRIVNTRNIDNESLVIDHGRECEEHNQRICAYLKEKESYAAYLDAQCTKLSEIQEKQIIDRIIYPKSLKSYTKLALKNWVKILKKQKIVDDYPLKALLKNDARRSVLIRGIINSH